MPIFVDEKMMSRAYIAQKPESQPQKPEIVKTQNPNAKARN